MGTEVAVGVIGTRARRCRAVEIVPKGGTYDYAARYTAGATEYFAPATARSTTRRRPAAMSAMAAWAPRPRAT